MGCDDAAPGGGLFHERPRNCSRQNGQTRRGQEGRLPPLLQARTFPSQSSKPRTTTTRSAPECSRRSNTPRCSTCPSRTAPTATPSWSMTAPAPPAPSNGKFPSTSSRRPKNLGALQQGRRATRQQQETVARRTITTTAPARRRATTSSSPSTAPSKPSPGARIASCWSWRPAPARPTRRFKSSGGCGSPARRSASCSSPTATSSSIRPRPTTSSRSVRR